MTWEQEMIRIYDTYYQPNQLSKKNISPLFHEYFNAGIEIIISSEGKIVNARTVDKKDQLTLIPVTERSAGRSGKLTKENIHPHPLEDQLKYIAKDYSSYFSNNSEAYSKYIHNLHEWVESSYSHPKTKAIFRCVKQVDLISELKQFGVIEKNAKETKVNSLLVRFIVNGCGEIGECWKDQSLIDSYIAFYQSEMKNSDLSYLSGTYQPKTMNFPKYIRYPGDNAKLFSCNRKDDFTFKGRFADANEILSIGSIDSQKMHNALKWMIHHRGIPNDSYVTVVWNTDMDDIPLPDKGTDELLAYLIDKDNEEMSDVDQKIIMHSLFTREYKEKIDPSSTVYLLSFDSATTGRLSLIQQAVLQSSQYLDNLEKWHVGTEWKHRETRKNGGFYLGVPNIKEIIYALYGTESKYNWVITENEKAFANRQIQKLYSCIVLNRSIPKELVNRAIYRASMPVTYEKKYHWNELLAIACSLVKKQHSEKKEEYTLTIATGELGQRRDYLYGRLLAIADVVEEKQLKKHEVERPTNAMRYMNVFAKHPYRTWQIIHENILPYLNTYKGASHTFYLNLLQSVMTNFKEGDFENDKPLKGLYLLGYYSQREDLYAKSEKDKEEGGNEE